MFGPEVVACGLRAAKNGSYGGKPVGDTRMMPGAFLVQRGSGVAKTTSIVWTHTYRHIADHPSFQEIGQQLDTTQRAETSERKAYANGKGVDLDGGRTVLRIVDMALVRRVQGAGTLRRHLGAVNPQLRCADARWERRP